MKIYVVLSTTQDECSAANRAFISYEKAFDYAQQVKKELGYGFYIIGVDFEE